MLTSLELGGAERVALTLATKQAARGDQVSVLALTRPDDATLVASFRRAGVTVARLPKLASVDPAWPLRLASWFRKERVAVVHTHNELPLLRATGPARLVGARIVHTKHGPHPAPLRERVARRLASMAVSTFVAVSRDTARAALAQREVYPAKLRIIDNGIELAPYRRDPAIAARVRETLGFSPTARLVGSVGRLAPVKNHEGLLRALVPYLTADRHLVVVGEGSERSALARAATVLGIERHVRWLGARDDVPQLLQAFDALVVSSHVEGQPLVVIEAMAAGVPVVSYAVGGIPDAFGDAAYLVPSGDEEGLGRATARVTDDAVLAGELVRRGAALVEARHSAEAMVAAYDLAYGLTTGRPPARPLH